ncbi:glutathione S-transferase family protein [Psychrobacter sp. I-STPA6b]|uniref:glutathione S-transferase family protein n=1 Tax=Psychrobacter sp. I-STPA6b TaxID=2585718 RepID=UPI001D0CBBA5|nr:glutathione S-transferase [Psychrobacter sp. I-STPA6b]
MIRLHHLNQSRSLRILWLLEVLKNQYDIDYEVITHQRDPVTHLATESLKAIHPLGKSPVIEVEGEVVAESGAIVEFLIDRYAPDLRPQADSMEYAKYLQWIHFAESSLMLPILMEVFVAKEGIRDTQFLLQYIDKEKSKVLNYLNDNLANKSYLVADKLTGADFMLSFVVLMLNKKQALADYPHIAYYAKHLMSLPSLQQAMALEKQYDMS